MQLKQHQTKPIQFNISHLSAHSSIINQFYLTRNWDPNRTDQLTVAMKGYSIPTKAPVLVFHYQIQLSIVSSKLVRCVLSLYRDAIGIFYSPPPTDILVSDFKLPSGYYVH